jgi:hypothetical protein
MRTIVPGDGRGWIVKEWAWHPVSDGRLEWMLESAIEWVDELDHCGAAGTTELTWCVDLVSVFKEVKKGRQEVKCSTCLYMDPKHPKEPWDYCLWAQKPIPNDRCGWKERG